MSALVDVALAAMAHTAAHPPGWLLLGTPVAVFAGLGAATAAVVNREMPLTSQSAMRTAPATAAPLPLPRRDEDDVLPVQPAPRSTGRHARPQKDTMTTSSRTITVTARPNMLSGTLTAEDIRRDTIIGIAAALATDDGQTEDALGRLADALDISDDGQVEVPDDLSPAKLDALIRAVEDTTTMGPATVGVDLQTARRLRAELDVLITVLGRFHDGLKIAPSPAEERREQVGGAAA